MGKNGTYCENLQIFCGKMGITMRQNPKETPFPGPRGLWGGVLSHMSEEKWGKMGENGEKWVFAETYPVLSGGQVGMVGVGLSMKRSCGPHVKATNPALCPGCSFLNLTNRRIESHRPGVSTPHSRWGMGHINSPKP